MVRSNKGQASGKNPKSETKSPARDTKKASTDTKLAKGETPAPKTDTPPASVAKAPAQSVTRCRIVEFTPPGENVHPYPAMVTNANGDGTVNLHMFVDRDYPIGGDPYPAQVPEGKGPGTWAWPARS